MNGLAKSLSAYLLYLSLFPTDRASKWLGDLLSCISLRNSTMFFRYQCITANWQPIPILHHHQWWSCENGVHLVVKRVRLPRRGYHGIHGLALPVPLRNEWKCLLIATRGVRRPKEATFGCPGPQKASGCSQKMHSGGQVKVSGIGPASSLSQSY